MADNNLEPQKQIIMRNLSRIQKSPKGCFSLLELERRHEIKENNIDVGKVINILIGYGLIQKGNKKDIYCVTHDGKLLEHKLEEEYNKEKYGYSINRNRYDRR